MRISDWSSDVCSSDLPPARGTRIATSPQQHHGVGTCRRAARGLYLWGTCRRVVITGPLALPGAGLLLYLLIASISLRYLRSSVHIQIGRASCRERVCQYV